VVERYLAVVDIPDDVEDVDKYIKDNEQEWDCEYHGVDETLYSGGPEYIRRVG
jgi:hypothetical protein